MLKGSKPPFEPCGANLAEKQQPLLVSGVGNLETESEPLQAEVEAEFVVSASTDLRFPPIFQLALADYLCHRVTREPSDLRSHVRRIFLAHEQQSTVELFGALVDLFIALGNKGLRLRQRMLEWSKENLEARQYGLLRESLAGGLDERTVAFVHGAMLCRGVEGSLKLVESGAERSREPRDPLVEAREYLEYSQLDEARNLLEEALMQDPRRQELHEELLEIYRSTRDQSNFAKMLGRLNKGNPMLEQWQELAEYFRSLNV